MRPKQYVGKETRQSVHKKQLQLRKQLQSGDISLAEFTSLIKKNRYTPEMAASDDYDMLQRGDISLMDYTANLMSKYPRDYAKKTALFSAFGDTLRNALSQADMDSTLSALSSQYGYNFSMNKDRFSNPTVRFTNKQQSINPTAGNYRPNSDDVFIFQPYSYPYGKAKTLLHELTHATDDSVMAASQDTIPYSRQPREILANVMAAQYFNLLNKRGKQ